MLLRPVAATSLSAYSLSPAVATFVAPFNGTTTAQAAGSGTPTTATGAIRYSGSKSALSFDGASDYILVSNASSLQFTNQLTAEGWFYITSTTTSAVMGLIGQTSGAGQSWKWYTGSSYSNRVDVEFHANSQTVSPSFGTVTLNTWTHYAMTYDGSAVKLYKNGVYVTQSSISGNVDYPTAPIYVGR